jgi:hypothetical protein
MDFPRAFRVQSTSRRRVVEGSAHDTKESDMNATSVCPSVQSTAGVIVGVDLAKSVSSCVLPTRPGVCCARHCPR